MVDYYSVALAGFATGAGVIAAQKVAAFLERHPLIIMFKRKAEDFTGVNERRRPR